MPLYEVTKRIDIDPDDLEADAIVERLLAEAQRNGGFLHIEIRRMKSE